MKYTYCLLSLCVINCYICRKRIRLYQCRGGLASSMLVAKTDITVSIAKPVVINLFDIIILII